MACHPQLDWESTQSLTFVELLVDPRVREDHGWVVILSLTGNLCLTFWSLKHVDKPVGFASPCLIKHADVSWVDRVGQ